MTTSSSPLQTPPALKSAPPLNVSLAEAMAFSMPLPEPISVLTGAHVNAFLRAMHAAKMEALLAPPPADPEDQ